MLTTCPQSSITNKSEAGWISTTFLTDLLVIEDCGHVVNIEKPDKFNIGMLGFLNESGS